MTTKRAHSKRRSVSAGKKWGVVRTTTRPLARLSQGWTLTSTTLAELYVEVETIIGRVLVEKDVSVVFDVGDSGNRYVQVIPDDIDAGIWCETVSDVFLGTEKDSPNLTPAEIGSLLRDRWDSPNLARVATREWSDPAPNWHRHIPLETPGAPALASQLLVSTLIDVHGVRSPAQIRVSVVPRWG